MSTPADPTRTTDYVPADVTAAHEPPEDTLPPNGPAPTDTFDPNRTSALDTPARALPADEIMPGYEVFGELGRGGMGVVYRARDTRLNRVVALKMILGRPGISELLRFRAEAEAMAAVRHPHVAQVYEVGEHNGRPFLAMELLPGGTLAESFTSHRDRGPAALAEVVRKVASGVAAAHAAGIVHRDLKPGNVLFDEGGEPKVTDFGLAKRDAGSDLTATGAILGTPAYMAPEQAGGNAKFVGPAADVWALGVILYEALTGSRPFTAPDVRGLLAQVLTADPVPPRKRNRAVPRDLELICLTCLAKEPHERYPTAAELADDLGRFARGEPISVRPPGPVERAYKWVKRNKVVSGAAAAVVLALATGTAVSLAFGLEAREQANEAWRQQQEAARQAGLANEAAEREKDAALRANREAARAVTAENEERKRSGQLGVALGRATKAEGDANQKAADALAEAKESRRRLDLFRVADAENGFNRGLAQVARDTLAEVSPENRCLAWGLLNRRCEGGLFTLDCRAHGLFAVAVSGDGSRVVTGSKDHVARVWDARTGRLVAELRGHTGPVRAVSVSADGARVLTGSEDRTARVWDVATGRLVAELTGHTDAVFAVALSADGSRAVTGTLDIGTPVRKGTADERRTARVWDATTGRKLATLPVGPVWNLAVSADGSRVASGNQVWDTATGRRVALLVGHQGDVAGVALSADGTRVVTGSRDRTAAVWDVGTGKRLVTLTGHADFVLTVAVSADGSRVVTGSKDGSARVWDARTGRAIVTLAGHAGEVLGVGISADGSRAVTGSWEDKTWKVTGSWDDTVQIWDARTGQAVAVLRGHTSTVCGVAVSADGSRVVTETLAPDYTARVWDGRTGQATGVTARHGVATLGAAISADGSRAVSSGRLWDTRTGERIAWLSTDGSLQTGVAITPDGSRAVTGSADGVARVWDGATGRLITELKGHTGPVKQVKGVAISADGLRVVTGSIDKTGRVWDVRTNQTTAVLTGHAGHVNAVAITPDGSRVVTGSEDRTARVWDAATGRQLAELTGHAGGVNGVAITADGLRVVTGSQDGTARVWDARTGRPLVVLAGHDAAVTSVAVSGDGSRVVTGSEDKTARVWEARPLDQIPPADELARRLWLTRPDPGWHAQRQRELAAEGNAYGAPLQRSRESHARGVLAFEAGNFDTARGYFLQAALLVPPIPKATDPAPPRIPPARGW